MLLRTTKWRYLSRFGSGLEVAVDAVFYAKVSGLRSTQGISTNKEDPVVYNFVTTSQLKIAFSMNDHTRELIKNMQHMYFKNLTATVVSV